MDVVGLMVLVFCLVSNMSMSDLSPHVEIYTYPRMPRSVCIYILVRIQSSWPTIQLSTAHYYYIILYNIQGAAADLFRFCFFHFFLMNLC